MSKSLSIGKGKGSLSHNNREFQPKNADPSRKELNITYKKQPLDEAYQECFGEALERYNNKQKRADRKIDDYYEHLFNNQSKKKTVKGGNNQYSFYEDVIQIGTKDDSGCGTFDGDKSRDALDEYMKGWQERNPQLYCFNAVLHLDEATPHLHIDYIPVATGYKNGLEVQNGLNKAIEQMGYKTIDKKNTAFMQWRGNERQILMNICKNRDIEIAEKGKTRGISLLPDDYKAQKDAEINRYTNKMTSLEADIKRHTLTTSKISEIPLSKNLKKTAIGDNVILPREDYIKIAKEAKSGIVNRNKDVKGKEKHKNLVQDNKKLKAENNALKIENSNLKEANLDKIKEITSLKYENSRIRGWLEQIIKNIPMPTNCPATR